MELTLLKCRSQNLGRYYCHPWFLCEGIRVINEQNSDVIHLGCLHGSFHTIIELNMYVLGSSIWIHRLIRPGIIVVGGSIGQQPPDERFSNTIWDKVVYFKTLLISFILIPWIYQFLTVTFTFKERYITHYFYQTNWITTDLKLGSTKGNFVSSRL